MPSTDNIIWFARIEEKDEKVLDFDAVPENVWYSYVLLYGFIVFILGVIVGLLLGLGVG